jgi:GDP-L-fucose synthase
MQKDSRIFIAGSTGLVGSAVTRNLRAKGYHNLLTPTHAELDLLDQARVHNYFRTQQIEYVVLAAAKVGGILYNNNYQADFLYENLVTSCNVIHAAAEFGTKKLLFLGSSCIYPKHAPQPIREESLLSGALEPTNEGYALSKIAGLKLCEKFHQQYGKCFISAMPTNLYGPGDNFHPQHSHVIPGLLRRFHEAKVQRLPTVKVWGSGQAKREFLFVDDLAEALHFLLQKYEGPGTINIGTGVDLSILELAQLVQQVVEYPGQIELDPSKPDGTPRKVLDTSRITALGWNPQVSLKHGLEIAYRWALEHGRL